MSDPSAADTAPAYRVLARKYRPATFADLKGQETMVRTLSNAFASDRIAHAFILTGVRGVGKTTTARIVAKGLNCVGPDGTGGPTVAPCGVCAFCEAIAEGRHVDVMEMDAASRTGVGDIREIIDGVRYRAASARYKVYIIDEIHMLSVNAFNALLKTLEEPPAHVKFIFATTEIRKVPVTVLSRCQRFDLRRIEPEVMVAYLAELAGREGVEIGAAALGLIARASEGSMRDALSLLDQAIARGQGAATAEDVRAMLGLADRTRVLDLFALIMAGDAAGALAELSGQYADGADPAVVLRDLAEVAHWLSVVKIAPEVAADPTVAAEERAQGLSLAERLAMPVLSRAWQMVLKAIEEVALAPNAMMAAEMAVIRLCYVADLPTPGDLVQRLEAAPGGGGGAQGQGDTRAVPPGAGGTAPPPASSRSPAPPSSPTSGPAPSAPRATLRLAAEQPDAAPEQPMPATSTPPAPAAHSPPAPFAPFETFDDVVALIRSKRDVKLLVDVEAAVRLVRYRPGLIEFSLTASAPEDLVSRLAARLQAWTGQRWGVAIVSEEGGPTLAETRAAARRDAVGQAMAHPLVQAAFGAFPGLDADRLRILPPPVPEAEPAPDPSTDPETPGDDPDWSPVDPFS